MGSNFEKYRFQRTPLTDETFNRIWKDIDNRIAVVEQLGFAFSVRESELIAEALSRINEEIQPVVEQIEGFAHLGNLLYCESVTPVAIGTGAKTFIVDEAFRNTFAAPLYVIINAASDATKWMAGQITAWTPETGTLVVAVTDTRGSGTFAGWQISVCSIPPETPPATLAENVALSGVTGITATHVKGALAEHQGDIDSLNTAVAAKASLDSPALTGTPSAPTQASADNSTKLATTAFVKLAIAALIGSAPATLDTLNEIATALNNDASAFATLAAQIAAKASLASPAFTGNPTAPTAATTDNATSIATTAFVKAAIAALAAPLASPVFTGTPAAPTAGAGTNTTQLATTAFVQSSIANRISSVIKTPARPSSAYVVGDITPSISGSTLTLTITWDVDDVGSPPSQESSTGG